MDTAAIRNDLLRTAFTYFVSSDRLWEMGRKTAVRRGLDPDACEEKFEAMYYDRDPEVSLNSEVYGWFHDSARDDWAGWCTVEDLDKLDGRKVGEVLPL